MARRGEVPDVPVPTARLKHVFWSKDESKLVVLVYQEDKSDWGLYSDFVCTYDLDKKEKRPKITAQYLNDTGFEHYKKKDLYRAVAYFDAAVEMDKSYDLARYNLACTLSRLNALEKSIDHLRIILRHNPKRFKPKIAKDEDLDPLRKQPEYDELMKYDVSGCPDDATGPPAWIDTNGTVGSPALVAQTHARDKGVVRWSGYLNGDGVKDLLVTFQGCGNWGECPIGVYAGCGEATFVTVVSPDYFFQLDPDVRRVGSKRQEGWLRLIETQRGGSSSNDDLYVVYWVFRHGRYQRDTSKKREIRKGPY